MKFNTIFDIIVVLITFQISEIYATGKIFTTKNTQYFIDNEQKVSNNNF